MMPKQSLNSFEELDCCKECRTLRIQISRVQRKWPSEEKLILGDGFASFREQLELCWKLLNGYIGYLQKAAKQQ